MSVLFDSSKTLLQSPLPARAIPGETDGDVPSGKEAKTVSQFVFQFNRGITF